MFIQGEEEEEEEDESSEEMEEEEMNEVEWWEVGEEVLGGFLALTYKCMHYM